MPDRDFLENYPLYRKHTFAVPPTLDKIPQVSINMWCDKDKSDQTFSLVAPYYNGYPYSNYPSQGLILDLTYRCAACETFERRFLIRIGEDLSYLQKVGQYPGWDVSGDANVEALLGDHAVYYRRGLITESQGYGIGAFAYYRRIVEEVIDSLLDEVADLIPEAEREAYVVALGQAKQTRVTSDKIDLVKDMLPPILRPDGMNPLGTLHTVLSEGLHVESDERCLELAMATREVLVFLTSQVAASKSASKSFTDRMRQLLDRTKPDAA